MFTITVCWFLGYTFMYTCILIYLPLCFRLGHTFSCNIPPPFLDPSRHERTEQVRPHVYPIVRAIEPSPQTDLQKQHLIVM